MITGDRGSRYAEIAGLPFARATAPVMSSGRIAGHFALITFNMFSEIERPKPNANHGAGLNVSPALRDYLALAPTDVTDWQFVGYVTVPSGPWRSYGENNHFVIARRQNEQRQMEQKSQQSDQNSKK